MAGKRKLVVMGRSKDPYPPSIDFRISKFEYTHHLQMIRYSARPRNSPKNSEWQLVAEYAVEFDIDYKDASGKQMEERWKIVAPKGLYTDLTSVPAFGRWIVAKVGPQLEASIIHDYLYLKWTDKRLTNARQKSPRFSDWVFADELLRVGMKGLKDFSRFQRFVVNFAVGTVGWWVFKCKKRRLKESLRDWVPHLKYRPHKTVDPAADERPQPKRTRVYNAVTVLVFVAIVMLGIDWLLRLLFTNFWQGAITLIADIPIFFFYLLLFLVGVALVAGLLLYIFMRTLIWIRKRRAMWARSGAKRSLP